MVNRRQFLATVAAAPASAQIVASSGKTGFRTGFAERDISPDIGMEEPGGYGKAYHRSFHDPCKVRAAVFDDGNQRVALVGIDSCSVARFITLEARKAITAQCGISPDAVMVGASHSHSSGPLDFVLPGEYDHAPALVQKLSLRALDVSRSGLCGQSTTRNRYRCLPGGRVENRSRMRCGFRARR